MRRHLRKPLALFTLVLGLALLVQWGRSLGAYEVIGFGTTRYANGFQHARIFAVDSLSGSIGVWYNSERDAANRPDPGPSVRWLHRRSHSVSMASQEFAHLLGFAAQKRYRADASGGHDASFRLMLPYWFLALLLAVAPLRAFRRLSREHARLLRGLCASCGYDLRGSPARRCPECGSPTPSAAAEPTTASAAQYVAPKPQGEQLSRVT